MTEWFCDLAFGSFDERYSVNEVCLGAHSVVVSLMFHKGRGWQRRGTKA